MQRYCIHGAKLKGNKTVNNPRENKNKFIWGNGNIKLQGKLLFFKNWIHSGNENMDKGKICQDKILQKLVTKTDWIAKYFNNLQL